MNIKSAPFYKSFLPTPDEVGHASNSFERPSLRRSLMADRLVIYAFLQVARKLQVIAQDS